MTRAEVYALLDGEREHQKRKWGDVPQTVSAWLLIIRQELEEAMLAWVRTGQDRFALDEIRQVCASCVVCMEQHETPVREKVP